MKLFSPLVFAFLLIALDSQGQGVPQGMKYQAVARNLEGRVMKDQDIQLKISLYSDPVKHEVAYMEIHKVITNELGLFSLSIGQGIKLEGNFQAIPWSSEEIWMEVAVQTDDETDYITISDSKMLSVPYAFHAATAGELTTSGGRGSTNDPYLKTWNLLANFNTVPGRDKLGTGDMADLVIVTNNTERMRIASDGDVDIKHNVNIDQSLTVQRDVFLNTENNNTVQPASFVPGQTINYGNLTVENESITHLTGTLITDGHTELNTTLNVDGLTTISNPTQSTSPSSGALVVDGGVGIEKNLNVGGKTNLEGTLDVEGIATILNTTQSTDIDNGALVVDGGVGIEKNLFVGGTANFEGETNFGGAVYINDDTQSNSPATGALVVAGGVGVGKNLNVGGTLGVRGSNMGYMAKIENTHGSDGDGLEIKLGQIHPGWDGGGYINVPNPGAEFYDNYIGTIRGWVTGQPFEFTDVLNLVPYAYIAGTACNLVETLSGELNSALGLPVGFPGLTDATIFDAVNSFADDLIADSWRPDNPTTLIPGFNLQFPTDFCPDFLPSFTMPNINFVNVTNSLENDDQFISFKDKDDRELGSIRAMSVTEWGEDYFDGAFLVDFIGNTVSLDPLDIVLSCVKEFTIMADDYNKIGVEYTSGHGDYAEWLERQTPGEIISRGDIVAVKAGKITKDLTGAEQVMAISEFPIVLGNAPDKGKVHLGNNVAFMGQIPVKVMGPVVSGDYIVANHLVPGYGIAKAQNALTIEDMPLVVGRSWETKPGAGPKMVNTVVGVHNGDYFKILENYEQKLNDAEARMDLLAKESAARMGSLEARVDMLMQRLDTPENE